MLQRVALTLLFFLPVCVFAEEPAEDSVIRVACVGDSITFGSGIKDRDNDSYPAQMQKLLGEKYRVENFGVAGATIHRAEKPVRGTWYRSYDTSERYEPSLEFQPHIVVINLGINDTARFTGDASAFVPGYVKLIESYRALPTKPRIYIWKPVSPIFPGHKNYQNPGIPGLTAALAEVAEKTGVETIDLYEPMKDQPELVLKDGVHPNPQGAAVIAKTVAEAIAAEKKPSTVPTTQETEEK